MKTIVWHPHTQPPSFYRLQAFFARRAASAEPDRAIRALLDGAAHNLEEIAEDLEAGDCEIRNAEWLHGA